MHRTYGIDRQRAAAISRGVRLALVHGVGPAKSHGPVTAIAVPAQKQTSGPHGPAQGGLVMRRRSFPIPSAVPSARPGPGMSRAGTLAVLFLLVASVLPVQAASPTAAAGAVHTSQSGFKATVGHALHSD